MEKSMSDQGLEAYIRELWRILPPYNPEPEFLVSEEVYEMIKNTPPSPFHAVANQNWLRQLMRSKP